MPPLDVIDALDDIMLQDIFNVLRRPITMDTTGRSMDGAVQFSNVVGVVYPSKGGLHRSAEGEMQDKGIVVTTRFPLRGASVDSSGQGFHPDIITWGGNNFLVDPDLKDWSLYATGFVRVECTLLDMQSAPPVLQVLQGTNPPPIVSVSMAGKLQLYTAIILSTTQAKISLTLQPANIILLRNGLPQFSPADYSISIDQAGNSIFNFVVPLSLNGASPDTINVYV